MRRIRVATVFALLVTVTAVLLYSLSTSTITTEAVLSVEAKPSRNIVDKGQGEVFTIEVGFKNTGGATGTWTMNVALEGEANWNWHAAPQNLTLAKSKSTTITWKGNVPMDAKAGSTTRLVVYFNDQYAPQNWWIHVLPAAHLDITQSKIS